MESTLSAEIAEAFAVQPVIEAGGILYNEEPAYSGSFPVESELADIRNFFGGREWTNVGPTDLFKYRHAIFYFSAKAFIYSLPRG